MSVTYDLACRDCKQYVWIGQSQWLYVGDPAVDKLLQEFLFGHIGHNLVFLDTESIPMGFEDIGGPSWKLKHSKAA